LEELVLANQALIELWVETRMKEETPEVWYNKFVNYFFLKDNMETTTIEATHRVGNTKKCPPNVA